MEGVVEAGRRGNIFVQSKGGIFVVSIISRIFRFCGLLFVHYYYYVLCFFCEFLLEGTLLGDSFGK